ncbi:MULTISPECIES: allophanate hydrolase subunit 1 [unclassified Nonomuraea]|uniref:5-oxoprolinase subunit B family protein n=1 Tax=unclassified Nonomuraea TaxID=2593643 RepID=UPI0033DB1371
MIRGAGEHGLLVETGALEVSHRLDALLRADRPDGVVEIVPGPETVLVVAPGADRGRLRAVLERLLGEAGTGDAGGAAAEDAGGVVAEHAGDVVAEHAGDVVAKHARDVVAEHARDVVRIPVVYDGEDLASVAELAGLSPEEVVARHTGRDLVVGWLGFAPGFAYLTGLDPALHLPRLGTPRTSVPAGSVAVAGPYSAVYPSASPGGWRLLGRTSLRVWDVTAEPPSPFRPGTRVRFERA